MIRKLFICCYRPPSGNLQLFREEFLDLLVTLSSEYICCGDFNTHVNRTCSPSNDFKDILDEFGLVQSVQLPTHKSGTLLIMSLDHKSMKCLDSVSTSNHKWLIFDCLKYRLQNCEKPVLKFRNVKNVNLVDFIEDCFYHLWSAIGSPLIDCFLETLQTDILQKRREIPRNTIAFFRIMTESI